MIRLLNICKNYEKLNSKLVVLDNISLHIQQGEFVAITGPSGSGKSSLLAILGCLDGVSSGEYILDNESIFELPEPELCAIRNQKIGFIFQSYNLISSYSALKNVELPMLYAGISADVRSHRAELALRAVGLAERLHHKPSELSGGQQQRVAIARAIVNNPDIIIADEATGSLDENSTQEIMSLFSQLHQAGKTIIFVTHNTSILQDVTRIVSIDSGQIIEAQ